jgi:protein involved in polysaccharide export with SLBB domain
MKTSLFSTLLLVALLPATASAQVNSPPNTNVSPGESGSTLPASNATRALGSTTVTPTIPKPTSDAKLTYEELGWLERNLEPPSKNTSPTAAANAAVPTDLTQLYRVGCSDVLDIQITQNRLSQSTLFTVLDDGTVDYPLAGAPLQVKGLTTAEIAGQLRQRIKLFDAPNVVVKVRDFGSHAVTVNGFVSSPGIKTLRREAVPLYVVLAEALPLPEASLATIIRKGVNPIEIKIGDPAGSATWVFPGDVIRVTADPIVLDYYFAGGEVNAPGQKVFHKGMTLSQAILASGGLNKNAGVMVRVSRQGSDGKLTALEYNLADIRDGKAVDPFLVKGDRIEVAAP